MAPEAYLEVYVATSKTDQEGKGRYVQITEMPGQHPLCAVRAVEQWITRAGIAAEPNSPLFRAFTPRGSKIKATGISGRDLALALKRIARATGRDDTNAARDNAIAEMFGRKSRP